MDARLLVDTTNGSSLASFLGLQCGVQVNLEALGKLVLELNQSLQGVGGSPGLSEGDSVSLVCPLGLKVAIDRALVAGTKDTEGNIGWSLRLDLESGVAKGVVFAQEVIGRLSEILNGIQ